MNKFAIAVKAFIIKDNKLLILQRKSDNVHKPGAWDIPGGRCDQNEHPYVGCKREVKEETGLDVDITLPLDIQKITRDDGQEITMIFYLCKPKTEKISLTEHDAYEWREMDEADKIFPMWMKNVITIYKNNFHDSNFR